MPFFVYVAATNADMNRTHVVHKRKKETKQKAKAPLMAMNFQARTNLPIDPRSSGGGQGSGTQGSGTSSAEPKTLLPGDAAQTPQTPATGGDQTQQPKVLMPTDAQSPAKVNIATAGASGSGSGNKLKWVHDVYFDAGASDLVGTFTTQVLRYGVRYEQHEIHVYGKNETLDTRGTNLPFQSMVTGASAGIGYRYWLPGNRAFVTTSYGKYISGDNKNKTDFRVGLAGYYDWATGHHFTDFYGDLFYIDIAKDTFISARLRSGLVVYEKGADKGTVYAVLQGFESGKGANGTENRIEAGFGVGYVFQKKISLNVELRAGYAYRGVINNRQYLNPQIVIAGGL